MDTLAFDSDDLAETEAFFSQAYARMRIGSGTPGGNRAQLIRHATDMVSTDELDLRFDMDYSVTPLGRICLCVVHDGTIEDHAFHGVRDDFGPGDAVCFAPPELPYSGRIRQARYNITMLDPDLLTQVADLVPRSRPEPVRLTGHRPHSPAAAEHLKYTITRLQTVLAEPGLARQPLVVSTLTQHLAATVLATFPTTAQTDPTGSDRADAGPTALRRAAAYIDDHADQDITLADMAAAAHVTIRTLQYAFRRHLDTTPLGYLRQVRLTHAHHDLRSADPEGDVTVTEVAARWGFHHPGRFAALYREAYGRTPRTTLRQNAR
ncbi:helix-turn-helix transcriptional regulator [Streptomyces sp. NPDC002573]|uniref:helix-turn-helix transcriptional regulator n=1 Tax=Streptomyces sp. NPDC002573 TaxID=3364651 RepID=UPI00367E540D